MKLEPLQALTNAPEVYDYGYVKVINPHAVTITDKMGTERKVMRLVQMPDDYTFNYQTGRYGSGPNFTITTQAQLDAELASDFVRINQ